ncbi:hypothetical protein NX059_009352 [Plenodomus lindquistii]|nr:hypothetical protein NX059_009352 [Plenodomus lindquistii]
MPAQAPPSPALNSRGSINSALRGLIFLDYAALPDTIWAGHDIFVGEMAEWETFDAEALSFYNDPTIQELFERVGHIPVDTDYEALAKLNTALRFNNTEVANEVGLRLQLLGNVVDPVVSVMNTLPDPPNPSNVDKDDVKVLSIHWDRTIKKVAEIECRARDSPYNFSMYPGGRSDGKDDRLVMGVKYRGNCSITTDEWQAMDSQKPGSIREMFGKIAGIMRERGTRFGLVTSYVDTVFLKIVHSESGHPSLLYSKPVPRTNTVTSDSTEANLQRISVRLGLLYLIHRTSHPDPHAWSFDPSTISKHTWTRIPAPVCPDV